MKREKKSRWFGWVLLGLLVISLIAVGLVLNELWRGLVAYEASSSDGALNRYFQRFAEGDYETAARESGFPFDEKATESDYIVLLKNTFGDDFSNLRYAEQTGGTEQEKEFNVYAGNVKKGKVRVRHRKHREANGDDAWSVCAVVEYQPPFTVTAPEFVSVRVNGVNQTPDGGDPIPYTEFEALPDPSMIPCRRTYRVEGYLLPPLVTGVTPDGYACRVTYDEQGNAAVDAVAGGEQERLFSRRMTEFSTLYARYLAKDAKFPELRPYLETGTPFYKDLTGFNPYWFTAHSGYEFRNVQVSPIIRTAEDLFFGTVSLDQVIFYKGEERIYHAEYRLVFRLVDGEWLLNDLRIL